MSGAATGSHTDPDDARRIKVVLPDTPVLIGSGFDAASAHALLAHADGALVGTSLKHDGHIANPVDAARVQLLRAAMR